MSKHWVTVPTQSLSLLLTFDCELVKGLGDAFNFTTRNVLARTLASVICFIITRLAFSKMHEMEFSERMKLPPFYLWASVI